MGTELLRFPWAPGILRWAEGILGYSPLDALGDPGRLEHTSYLQPLLLVVERLVTEALGREAGVA
ncbi:MAG: malonyl CoA-acyl carrier protein transacylase, partial [Caldiserica bacterium]|nr:malonyl CoA-acyl carrier protein transacylase [Caldisericota bacterium]